MGIQRFLVLSILMLAGLEAKWAPDYMIIGAQKSGTTAVFDYINQHPKSVNKVDEIHFFDDNYNKGIEWYWKQFAQKPDPFYVVGDKSPYYMFHPLVPRRIYKEYPNMKFIVVLRNPVDRAYSQYWMNRRLGVEKRSFEEAIEEEPSLLAGEEDKFYKSPNYKSQTYRRCSYLTRGYYAEQLIRWFTYFPEEQFLIITNDELIDDPQKTMNKVFSFLGMYHYNIKNANDQKFSKYPPMKEKTRKFLKHHFKSYNEDLEKMLNRKFPWDAN